MVAFETLLLGLVMHAQQVRLMVAPPVTAVVLRLDGATLTGLRQSMTRPSPTSRSIGYWSSVAPSAKK